MAQRVRLANRWIGEKEFTFIIAEVGVNHNGDIKLAHRLIDAAVEAGADAVKFQLFNTDEIVTRGAPKAKYQVETTGRLGNQYAMLKSLELSVEQHAELQAHCQEAGCLYLCTPYDNISADALEEMDVAAFKVASTDLTNTPFLRYLAAKGRPVILSTGMSTLGEVERAVQVLREGGLNGKVVLLHCTSEYPAPIREVNLRAILTMQQAFNCPVGFSDHTPGIGAAPWAVAIGACVIEKHFTLDRSLPGPDHRASLEPHEFRELVQAIRDLEAALGDGCKRPMPSELQNIAKLRKSLVARRPIQAGQVIKAEDLGCKRPGSGLPPDWLDRVVGKRAAVDIPQDGILTLASVDWSG